MPNTASATTANAPEPIAANISPVAAIEANQGSNTTAGTPPATPVDSLEIRYGPGTGVPEWLVGKTMREAADLSKQMYAKLLETENVRQAQVNFAAPAPAANDWAPALEARDQMLGAQARALAEMRYQDDFRRWGPEIDLALTAIPAAQLTPQVVDWIVRGVRGNHIDDLTKEAADAKIQRLIEGGTLRPQSADATGETVSTRVDFDKLPQGYSLVLKNLGVTASTVDEMLRSCYPQLPLAKAREKWMASAAKGDVFTDSKTGKTYFEGDRNG